MNNRLATLLRIAKMSRGLPSVAFYHVDPKRHPPTMIRSTATIPQKVLARPDKVIK
jgi:hypothetical protein